MTNSRRRAGPAPSSRPPGPTMMPGVSQRKRSGMSKASQSCMKRAALSAAVAVDGAAEVHRVVGDDADGRPSTRIRAVIMPTPKSRRSSSTESVSASVVDHRAHVVDAQPVLGDRRGAAAAGRRTPSRRRRPGSRTGTCCAARTASASSATAMSTTPFGACTLMGPTSSGRNTPRPPPSIMAGPPMPMFESAVAMMTSQQPSSTALPAKQRPEVMPTSGTSPLSRPKHVGTPGRVAGSPRRTTLRRCRRGAPAAALGEEHDGQPSLLGQSRTCGPSSGGSSCPGCRPAPCSRTTSRRSARSVRRTGRRSRWPRPMTIPSPACVPISSSTVPCRPLRRRSRASRTRRTCPGRTGRRCSRAPCAGRSCARRRDRPGAGRVGASARGGARPRPGRGGVRRGRPLARPPRVAASTSSSSMKTRAMALGDACRRRRRRSRGRCRRPARRITCSIFIASMTSTCWPVAHQSPSRTSKLTIVPCTGALIGVMPSGAGIVAGGRVAGVCGRGRGARRGRPLLP